MHLDDHRGRRYVCGSNTIRRPVDYDGRSSSLRHGDTRNGRNRRGRSASTAKGRSSNPLVCRLDVAIGPRVKRLGTRRRSLTPLMELVRASTAWERFQASLTDADRPPENAEVLSLFQGVVSMCLRHPKALLSERVREVPGVMRRVVMHPSEHFEMRFHMFVECSETYVHNHSVPFTTHCLQGGYLHRLWGIDPAEGSSDTLTGGCHHERHRAEGNALSAPERLPGRLVADASHAFQAGDIMHIPTSLLHTIVRDDAIAPSGRCARGLSAVTMVLKDCRLPKARTRVLSQQAELSESQEALIRDLKGSEKTKTVRWLLRILQNYSDLFLFDASMKSEDAVHGG